MPIGLALPQYGAFADPALTARVAAEAEAIGYDHLWTADRILVPNDPRSRYPGGDGTFPAEFRTFLDPLTLLTVAAGATGRVRLGTSTLNALWQPPALLARTLTTIDRLSGGRLDVGIGLGWSRDEYQAVGVPWEGKAARLEETLDVLEAFWAGGEDVRHTGALWTVPPSTVLALPVQRPRPPVLLGGVSPAALERAGRRSDGWLGVALPLPALSGIRDQLHRAARAAGRDPLALRLILRVNPVITATPAPAEQVPQRGTIGQLADYFTGTMRRWGAEPLLDLHRTARSADEYLALAREFHAALAA
ncbi:TIGR03619 family F420-dependent LLM class oxidoreductase [Kitasatospora sp. NPDC057692]|uniref:TIGR03619 family F420-dependent LLM class oxidoreductase n=1 Tax=Kitasatospora sp. NPDC057692 TaxID=3346215 RepID=UPI0036B26F1D